MKLCATLSCLSLCASAAHGWSKVGSVKAPPKVSGHSAVGFYDPTATASSGTTLVFGGLTGPAGSPCTDATWEFEPNDQEWIRLELEELAAKETPRKRMYAASASCGGKMYVFGGWDPGAPGSGGEFLDDAWEFDPSTKRWTELSATLPFPVSRHTACTVTKDGKPVIVLHTYKGILVYDPAKGSLEAVTTAGDATPDGFSMCTVAPLGSKMLLFGGATKTQQMSSDAYVLDTEDWTWTKLEPSGDGDSPPPPLASACAAPLSDSSVLVFGGASIGPTGYEGGFGLVPQNESYRLEVVGGDRAQWTKLDGAAKPEGRVAASLTPTGPSSFLLQGGYDPLTQTTFDESWVLSLE